MRMMTRILSIAAIAGVTITMAARPAGRRCDLSGECGTGSRLPAGFCATLFADSLPGARHMVVAPNGDVFLAAQGAGRGGVGGGIIALRDTNHDGHADVRVSFGHFRSSEARLFEGYLYAETQTAILRYRMTPGALEPASGPDTIVKDLPGGGNHPVKTFVIDKNGVLYVNVGTATNACQPEDRHKEVKGTDPCIERETRGGIWKFDARKLGQTQATGEHFGIGIRNSIGMDIDPNDNTLWVMQHGRDQLDLWPAFYTDTANAEITAEELFHVSRGDDMGWPYCYYDLKLQAKILAPEYGGNDKMLGRCADKKGHVAAFPAHWAPNALMFYRGGNFPAKYHSGVFIAFHGSWNRAPLPQAGFKVVFQPLNGDRAAGAFETFADGFITVPMARPPRLAGVQRVWPRVLTGPSI